MKYRKIVEAKFIERHNRFVASVELEGKTVQCHVKNTGRCKELLIPGAKAFLEEGDNPLRKYLYSLIAVEKGERLVNIDSSAPNKAALEWLQKGEYFKNITYIKPECTYGKSRFDFYFEYDGKKAFMEVKGVTLENEGVVSFPDAPTERGRKHVNELAKSMEEGFEAYILFVVQMKGVSCFTPNVSNDPEFSHALKIAYDKGVRVLCFDCEVTEDSMELRDEVSVKI